jgi:diacylglycerol kinase family enzyme
MFDSSDILFLFNPYSNEGHSMRSWSKLRSLRSYLPEKPIDITKIKDLSEFLKERNPRVVVACGGDGTINSVCSAVYTSGIKCPIAVFPLGFGNALAYCLGVETLEKCLEVLEKQPRVVPCDLFSTNIPKIPFAVFIAGIGFDARIVLMRMQDRYIGFRSYILSAIKSLFIHNKKRMLITVDDCVTFDAVASSLVVMNAPIIGKNYIIAENARLNDGHMNCVLFSTKYAYITNLRFRGFKHPLYTEENKVTFNAKKIRVSGETFVQIDGDPAIFQNDIEIGVVPNAISFLCNNESAIETSVPTFI